MDGRVREEEGGEIMKALNRLGLLLVLFGIACGDSPNVLVPVGIIAVGGALYKVTERLGA